MKILCAVIGICSLVYFFGVNFPHTPEMELSNIRCMTCIRIMNTDPKDFYIPPEGMECPACGLLIGDFYGTSAGDSVLNGSSNICIGNKYLTMGGKEDEDE